MNIGAKMNRYTIGVEAIIYDEIYVVAKTSDEAIEIAKEELKREYYDHYSLSLDGCEELEE